MIAVKNVKKFINELKTSGIPLSHFLQEKRETFEIVMNGEGIISHNQGGNMSGLNVGAYHQSGNSFCYTTDFSSSGLVELSEIITSPLSNNDQNLVSINIDDLNNKIGKNISVNSKDLELCEKLLEEYRGEYSVEINIWERYIETLSIESVLRNDKQKFYHVRMMKKIEESYIEDQFVTRNRTNIRESVNELVSRIHMRAEYLNKESEKIDSGKYRIVLTPYAASQFILMLLSGSFIINSPIPPEELSRVFGMSIGSKSVNLVDDPTMENGAGSYNVDDQGNPSEKKYLLKDGQISGFITSALAALNMGISPGPCRSSNFMNEPVPTFSNLCIEPQGFMSQDDIKNQFGEGIIVHSFNNPFLGERFGHFKIDIETGYYFNHVKDCEKTLKNVIIKGNLRDFLKNVTVCGCDFKEFSGLLMNYNQIIPQGYGSPSLGLEEIQVEQN